MMKPGVVWIGCIGLIVANNVRRLDLRRSNLRQKRRRGDAAPWESDDSAATRFPFIEEQAVVHDKRQDGEGESFPWEFPIVDSQNIMKVIERYPKKSRESPKDGAPAVLTRG